jgi:diadenosine tetraphosphate (Ap4A) HIT family hydrolase
MLMIRACSANFSKIRKLRPKTIWLLPFDGFPVNPGHVLVIPKRHVANYFELTTEEVLAIRDLLQRMKTEVDAKFHPDGYNIGVNVGADAGQSIFHVHVHLIPRYKGDVKNPRGGVRGVIPAKQSY